VLAKGRLKELSLQGVYHEGFRWINEAKGNRVLFYGEERLKVSELTNRMRLFFRDVEVMGSSTSAWT
jgi:hypothetical protein